MISVFSRSGRCSHKRCAALLLALLLQACAQVPFDYPKQVSTAPPASTDTRLGAAAARWQQQHDELSGFVGLDQGIDALGARLRMIDLAESSIDAQYFLIKPDRAGGLFAGKLLQAADRGVRVRLLLDDIFTTASDSDIALLDSHPNIEIRLFNPLSQRSLKYFDYLVDFQRANRRMHNKSFTVDSALSIVGGRNIAEEYFELNQVVQFDDFEVLAIGPVVSDISGGFDSFWNSDLSVPMAAFEVPVEPADLQRWRERMENVVDAGHSGLYGRAIDSPGLIDILEGRRPPHPAQATYVTDRPEKLQGKIGDREFATLAVEMLRRFDAADRELLIITPYFVPGKNGLDFLRRVLDEGVRVIIVTNSLASTNHVPVHAGYARYRKPLLQAGAEIYEINASAVEVSANSPEQPETRTLHSKASIIDRDTVFVGSLNFDPRSIEINSEMGLFIESAAIGEALFAAVRDSLSKATYRVTLDERGRLQWTLANDADAEPLDSEPLAGFGRRLIASLYRLLPIESQL